LSNCSWRLNQRCSRADFRRIRVYADD
jgi:hypothetical protein